MKKKLVALVLATAMIASQFMGAAESFAAGTAGAQVERATESERVNDSVEPANEAGTRNSDSGQGETPPPQVYAIFKGNQVLPRANAEAMDPTAGGAEITALETITDLVIDETVTEVPDSKFNRKPNITKLTFENAGAVSNMTTTIGASAFHGIGAKTVTLPKKLTTIKSSAFEGSMLTRIELPDSLTTMEHSAFKNTGSLTEVVVGAGLAAIKGGAFEGAANLTKLDLTKAAALTTVKNNSFKRSGLRDLYIGTATKVFSEEGSGNLFEELTVAAENRKVHFVGENKIYLDTAKQTALKQTWNKLTEAANGDWKFFEEKAATPNASANYEEMKLTGLAAGSTYKITIIGGADGGANLVVEQVAADGKIAIPKAWGGKALKIMIPATTEKLESDVQNLTLAGIYTVTTVIEGSETQKNVKEGATVSIEAPIKQGYTFTRWTVEGLDSIANLDPTANPLEFAMPARDVKLTPNYALTPADKIAILKEDGKVYERNPDTNEPTETEITDLGLIQDLLIDDAVVEVADNKFSGKTNITKLAFKNAGTNITTSTIGESAFKGTGITELVLPAGVTTIKASAFEGTKITGLELPDSLITMGASAFKGITGLTKVVAGSGLSYIDNGTFEGASALTTLDLRKAAGLGGMHENAFKNSTLTDMIIGKDTKVFSDQGSNFTDTTGNKIVHFKRDNGIYSEGADIAALEKKWAALKESNKGSWTFFSTRGDAPTAATADYTGMQLTGLTARAKYNLSVEEKPSAGRSVAKTNRETAEDGTITADNQGNVKIRKEWSNKRLKITTPATESKLESNPKEIDIEAVYTVTVNGEESEVSTAGREISVSALAAQEGQTFTHWTVTGLESLTEEQLKANPLVFNMPASNVTLTSNYKQNAPAAPNASVDYGKMKLTGLTPSGTYKVTVDNVSTNTAADSEGNIDILKPWSGKTIQLAIPETDTQLGSAAQEIPIKTIYTITVGESERISVQGQSITIKADTPEGYKFQEWTAEGVKLPNPAQETITFEMPGNNVKLIPSYIQIITTKPEELVYNGEKELSVKLEVTRTEFTGIQVDGKMLEENKDYTITEAKGAKTAAAGGITVTFTKAYLDTLKSGDQAFKVVLTTGEVNFSIKVEEKPAKPAVTYPDVKEGEWFYEAVMYVSGKEIMSGYADGTFGPADKLARGQFATILYRMAGSPAVEYKNIFSDVPEGQFYSLPAIWAQTNNVITGYADGKFGPSDSITREQLATMLYRYAMMKGTDVTQRVDLSTYPDAGKVSAFAKDAMSWVVAVGIIKGDQGNLNPQGDSSRAVVATMIQRFQTGK